MLGGAFIFAIIIAMIVQLKFAPKAKTNNAVEAGTEVLVAAKDLLAGETLKAEDARWVAFPDNATFKGMIKKKEQADEKKLEVYGKPLRRDIASGEPVTTQSVIVDSEGGGFLSAQIAPGMRAVGVSVQAQTTAGGFVTPGDYVDVVMTYSLSLKGGAEEYSTPAIQKFASETILSNVRVLAVDQNAKETGHEAKVARTVTLEVTKEGSQKLALATTMGDISLALRRLGEKDSEQDKRDTVTTDVMTSKVIQEVYSIMDKSKTTADTIRLYNGGTVTNVPVRSSTGTNAEAK